MHKRNIFIFLFNGFADWETAFITPEIVKAKKYSLHYFSIDGSNVVSLGGMTVCPDCALADVVISEGDMLILPGGSAWEAGSNDDIIPLIRQAAERKAFVAAICAATIILAQCGFLDSVKHTSNVDFYIKLFAKSYKGDDLYVNAPAVTGGLFITAGGVFPVDFSLEVFKAIDLDDEDTLLKWYQLFKNGIWNY